MGKLVAGAVLLFISFGILLAAATVKATRPGPGVGLLRMAGYAVAFVAALILVGSAMVVIDPGEVGVRRAFGYVDPQPLLSGIRFVVPWSEIERYSTREEQWPTRGEQIEAIEALSSEQMGMHVEVSIRWQIDPPLGSISANGTYIPPADLSAEAQVEITASSAADPTKSDRARVRVLPRR